MSTPTKERDLGKAKLASRPYEPWLREQLAADPEEARLYLEEALRDEDPRVFLVALKDVAAAYGGPTKLAKATGLNRENLYRMLSRRGNPEFTSLSRVLHALGFRLTVAPVAQSRSRINQRRHRSGSRLTRSPLVGARGGRS